jgi:hypothetical protein
MQKHNPVTVEIRLHGKNDYVKSTQRYRLRSHSLQNLADFLPFSGFNRSTLQNTLPTDLSKNQRINRFNAVDGLINQITMEQFFSFAVNKKYQQPYFL